MKALIELDGPSHRIMTAAALCGVLTRGHQDDDLAVQRAIAELKNFTEALEGALEETGEYWLDAAELERAVIGCEALTHQLRVAQGRVRACA